MRSPSNGLVVHVDADAFFAACEPADRRMAPDVPLAVTSSEQGGRSSRARTRPAPRGVPGAEGERSPRGAIRPRPRPAATPLYVEMHEAMVAAGDALAPVEHVPSVDGLALRVPRGEPPEAFVERVGEAVPRALGEAVQVSVGEDPS